jgi:hypothetical protein
MGVRPGPMTKAMINPGSTLDSRRVRWRCVSRQRRSFRRHLDVRGTNTHVDAAERAIGFKQL